MIHLTASIVPRHPAPRSFLGGALAALVQPLGATPPEPKTADALVKADLGFLVVELVLIGLLLIGLLSSFASQAAAVDLLISGKYAMVFWSGVIAAGIVLPLALQALQLAHHLPHTIMPALLVLAGGFALRWVMAGAGQASHIVASVGAARCAICPEARRREMSFTPAQSPYLRTVCRTTLAAVIFLGGGSVASAAEPDSARTYAGDFLTRSTMTGDWGGVRDEWARNGITVNADVTQTDQGVVSGGKDSSWQYGGRGNLTVNMDTGKMGLWPGGFLTVELEGSWGNAVNSATGALMTVNTNQAFPVVGETVFAVPAVSLRQLLSKDVSLVVGKLDTIATGDLNAFAHGKGDDQFMNLAFNVNPVLIMTVPYSTLGVGVVYMPATDPGAVVASLSLVSAVGEANTSGFSELSANALTVTGEARWRTDFFGQTGHQLLGFTYCNNEFTSLDQRLGAFLPTAQIQKKTGSWSAFWNFDQYLYEPQKRSGQGVGIFGRLGVADGNPNPARFFASLGLGGKGLAGRPYDDFGIAWYYLDVASPTFATDIGTRQVLGNEHGFEAYYTFALTRWALLTADLQVVNPSQKATRDGKQIDTDTVLGIRLKLVF